MLREEWLVKIYIDYGEHYQGDRYVISTGYTIRKGWVLTCRHALETEQTKRSDQYKLSIKWPFLPQRASGSHQALQGVEVYFTPQDIIYPKSYRGRSVDLALIQYDVDQFQEIPPIACIRGKSIQSTIEKTRWYARGFPKAAKEHKTREARGIAGWVQGLSTEKAQLELSVDADAKARDGWQGLSGAPIIINRQISGVVTEDHEQLDEYLVGVSLSEIIQEDKEFKEHLFATDEDFQQQYESFLDHIADKIKSILHDEAQEAFVQHLVQFFKQQHRPVNNLNSLIDYWLRQADSVKDVMASFTEIIEEMLEGFPRKYGYDQIRNAFFDLETIASWLLIITVDQQWFEIDTENPLNNDQLVHKLPLANPYFVEVIFSRASIQRAVFELDSEGKPKPQKASKTQTVVLDHEDFKVHTLRKILDELHQHLPKDHESNSYGENRSNKYEDHVKQFLKLIIDRLRRGDYKTENRSLDEVIDEAAERAEVSKARMNSKVVYYFVSVEMIELLSHESWFEKLKAVLAGKLYFIEWYELPREQRDQDRSVRAGENSRLLLQQFATFLDLEHEIESLREE